MVEYSQPGHPKHTKSFLKKCFIYYTLYTKSFIIFIKINVKHFYYDILTMMQNVFIKDKNVKLIYL